MNSNIVLIGMPGSGKSTCGVVAAKMLLKNFYDTDLLISVQHCNARFKEVCARHWDAFRRERFSQ